MTSTDQLLQTLRTRVDQRRQEGKYPPGLEEQLQAEFKAILETVHGGEDQIDHIGLLIEGLRRDVANVNGMASTHSRFFGGQLVHRIIGRLVARHTRGVAEQVQFVLNRQLELFDLMQKQLRAQRDSDSRVLHQLEFAIRDRVLMVDVLAESVLELERKSNSELR